MRTQEESANVPVIITHPVIQVWIQFYAKRINNGIFINGMTGMHELQFRSPVFCKIVTESDLTHEAGSSIPGVAVIPRAVPGNGTIVSNGKTRSTVKKDNALLGVGKTGSQEHNDQADEWKLFHGMNVIYWHASWLIASKRD